MKNTKNIIVLNSTYFIYKVGDSSFRLYKTNKNYYDSKTKTITYFDYFCPEFAHDYISSSHNVYSLLKKYNLSKYDKLFY